MDDYDYDYMSFYDEFSGYPSSFDAPLTEVGRGLENLDFGIPDQYGPSFDFMRGAGSQDLSSLFTGTYDSPYLGFGGELIFDTDEGRRVVYTPEGVVETTDPGGRYSYYHTGDGKDYFVDYSDIYTPGSLVETFNRDIGGEGPTGYTAYHGVGPDAKVVSYSDLYGPRGGTVTTTGGDGRQTVYQDGKATTTNVNANPIEKIIERASRFTEPTKQNALLAALLGGLMGLLGKGSKTTGSKGYQGGVPKYTAVRGPAASPTAGGRRPGGAGIGSLAGTTKYVPAAAGGLMGLKQGRYLDGPTDGMADQIKTDIDGKQPARLSHGEFVIPADVVSHLGNGNSDAGADVLYDMMAKVRKARTGNTKQGKQINPRKYTPA
jgi:hypothetical protein